MTNSPDTNSFGSVYKGKKVLITGNTGFKGSWLSTWLQLLGAEVSGFSNGVPTVPSFFIETGIHQRINYQEGDIRDLSSIKRLVTELKPDFIFHLAAQSLVRTSYEDPVLTFETNTLGTLNLLESVRLTAHPCNVVLITSDKAYDNVEWLWGYRETDALGGKDPYSASKGAAELAIKTYFHSYFEGSGSKIRLAVGRAGNVIGGGDWARDRVVPDAVRSWSAGSKVEIRSPAATRPWQHVLEPLSGYLHLGWQLTLSEKLNGEPFNFGPSADQIFSVASLLEEMQSYWPGAEWLDTSGREKRAHEATLLKLNCDKALHLLSWKPTLNFRETIRLTMEWYRSFYQQEGSLWDLSTRQIELYHRLATERGLPWTKD